MRIQFVFAVCLASVLAGCGGGSEGREPVHKVSGTVTLSGSPVGGASVSFAPEEKQRVATARTKDDGTFELTTYDYGDGAMAGKYKVLVSKSVSTSQASGPVGHDPNAAGGGAPSHAAGGKGAGDDEAGQLLNPKYASRGTTDLEAEVKPDEDNVFTFDLQP
jgi:hypothetical protein